MGRLAVVVIGLIVGAGLVFAVLIARDRGAAPAIVIRDPLDGGVVVVDVAGAVAAPGVYELASGAHIDDAIAAAGGATADADLAGLNRAALVRDGQRLVVPSLAPTAPPVAAVAGSPAAGAALVNINTATQAELEELPGIGPAKAKAIIAWREANGGFEAVDELRLVDGISDGLLEDLRPLVTVGA